LIDPQLSSKFWVVRKAVCVIGYYGGFRICELKSLNFENVKQDHLGYWFEFVRSKQRGRSETTSILVPRRQVDWVPVVNDSFRSATDIDPASFIDHYLELLQADYGVPLAGLTGSFFRGTQGKNGFRFIRTPLGKNKIAEVGVLFATELGLQSPECYTGHCWRRSCGTSASDAGVNVTTLMSLMGWATPKTAMEYVNKSKEKCIKMSMYLTNVQRQNRPLIMSENEFRAMAKKSKPLSSNPLTSNPAHSKPALSKPASSKTSLSSISNVRSVFKFQPVSKFLPATSGFVPKPETSSADALNDEVMEDAAALLQDVLEEEEVLSASQALIADLENEEKVEVVKEEKVDEVSFVSPVPSLNSVLEMAAPCLSGMFPNLSNSGSLNINIYFGK
jgi:hypothetical protein